MSKYKYVLFLYNYIFKYKLKFKIDCVKNHHVNSDILADYILFKLNNLNIFKYVDYYGLNEPTDDILDILIQIAKIKKNFKIHKGFDNTVKKMYDIETAARAMIHDFFNGHLGQIFLDTDILSQTKNENDLDLEKFV